MRAKLAIVENRETKVKRRKTPWVVGTLMVVSLAVLIILQSTNLWKDFSIESSGDLLLLYALSSLNFIAFVIFAFIFLRSIIKLVRERRTFELGAKIKTRMLIYFVAVSLLPIIAMAVFSYLFMNRALERWFTQIPENVIREARTLQDQSLTDRAAKLNETARMIATAIGKTDPGVAELKEIALAGNLTHIEILSKDGKDNLVFETAIAADQKSELDNILAQLRASNFSDPAISDGKGFDAALADLGQGRKLVIVPDPYGERAVSNIVDNSLTEFDRLKQKQIVIRQVGLLTLGVLTFLLIFASSWIAFYVARGLTTPIKALAEGADEIAHGNLDHRVDVFAEDELALLVTRFNEMAARLASNSAEITERRRYIETLVETLPTGVISFDKDDKVTTINRSAAEILRLTGLDLSHVQLTQIIQDENRVEVQRLIARARRVGHASAQNVIRDHSGDGSSANEVTAAMTATRLPDEGGVVLVIEDLSELIAAQRASAWQEVAQRMAHEIKNPLTPIQLSAERIAKRFVASGHQHNGARQSINDKGPIGDLVHESTATILREVHSLKAMVDEFSRFARLPDTKLERGDLNDAVLQALAIFEGRLGDEIIETQLAADLPDVLIDTEQIKRIFVNLIENSIEAFENDKVDGKIIVATRHDAARDLLIAEVADNGKGIAPSDLQKLFQPYFSTKGRGTGLGLAIVHRIVAEHHGRIHAVSNQDAGAKFIVELPVGT